MKQNRINNARRKLSRAYKINLNVCTYSKGQKKEHKDAMWRLFTCLRDLDYNVVTEAYFENGTRADVYCLETDVAYEVMSSEGLESIELKKEKYPCTVIALKAKEVIESKDLEKLL